MAYRRDKLERRGLVEAYRRGDLATLRELAGSLDFYGEMLAQPEYDERLVMPWNGVPGGDYE